MHVYSFLGESFTFFFKTTQFCRRESGTESFSKNGLKERWQGLRWGLVVVSVLGARVGGDIKLIQSVVEVFWETGRVVEAAGVHEGSLSEHKFS